MTDEQLAASVRACHASLNLARADAHLKVREAENQFTDAVEAAVLAGLGVKFRDHLDADYYAGGSAALETPVSFPEITRVVAL